MYKTKPLYLYFTFLRTSLFCLALLAIHHVIYAQQTRDPQQYIPQPFIDKIELVIGPSLNIPNDHGFGDRFTSNSMQPSDSYNYFTKVGYSFGASVIHSIKRIELVGKVMWETRGFKEEKLNGPVGNSHRYDGDTKIDYLTFSFTPRLLLGKSRRLYAFCGGSYDYFISSYRDEKLYVNDQFLQQGSTTNDPNISRSLVDLSIGLGYLFNISKKNALAIQFQGNQGINDIENINGLRLTSQNFLLSISFRHNRKIFYKQLTNLKL